MTYSTEVRLLLVWLVLAEVLALALTVVLLVRQPPPTAAFWRTVGKYFLVSSAIASCLPVLLLILRTVKAIAGVFVTITPVLADHWWMVPVTLAVIALAGVAWWFWSRRYEQLAQAPDQPAKLAITPLTPTPEPAMWSLPDEHRGGGL